MAFGDPLQWIIIGIIVVVIFLWGPQKIPQLAKALGRAKKEFDQASKEFEAAASETSSPAPASPKTADQILIEAARALGINTADKTREQISQEIIARSKPES
jgi:sec-independent protein translocase protein TatA